MKAGPNRKKKKKKKKKKKCQEENRKIERKQKVQQMKRGKGFPTLWVVLSIYNFFFSFGFDYKILCISLIKFKEYA